MLDTHCERKIEAEALYRRALVKEPKHPFALYNLAVLLEERLALLQKPKPNKKKKKISKNAKLVAVVPAVGTTDLNAVGSIVLSVGESGDDSIRNSDSADIPLYPAVAVTAPVVTFGSLDSLDPINDESDEEEEDEVKCIPSPISLMNHSYDHNSIFILFTSFIF